MGFNVVNCFSKTIDNWLHTGFINVLKISTKIIAKAHAISFIYFFLFVKNGCHCLNSMAFHQVALLKYVKNYIEILKCYF